MTRRERLELARAYELNLQDRLMTAHERSQIRQRALDLEIEREEIAEQSFKEEVIRHPATAVATHNAHGGRGNQPAGVRPAPQPAEVVA